MDSFGHNFPGSGNSLAFSSHGAGSSPIDLGMIRQDALPGKSEPKGEDRSAHGSGVCLTNNTDLLSWELQNLAISTYYCTL